MKLSVCFFQRLFSLSIVFVDRTLSCVCLCVCKIIPVVSITHYCLLYRIKWELRGNAYIGVSVYWETGDENRRQVLRFRHPVKCSERECEQTHFWIYDIYIYIYIRYWLGLRGGCRGALLVTRLAYLCGRFVSPTFGSAHIAHTTTLEGVRPPH